jgi:phage gp29-like protein
VVPEAGLIVQTPGIMQGWDFTASANLIGIGQIDSLGLLDSVALLYIHWKNTLISWTLYAEKFGMPMLSVETNTVDTERLDQIQDMLDNFGEDLSAIMQPGEKFTIVESGRADAYKVYQELLKMLQADVSKSILGQTMTMENGSSRAQAAVHYQVQLGVINADRRLVTDAINQQLKAALPWVPQEMTFEFRNREVMTMPERAALMESLHKVGARFEAGYLQEEFGVEIAGMATETSPNNGE